MSILKDFFLEKLNSNLEFLETLLSKHSSTEEGLDFSLLPQTKARLLKISENFDSISEETIAQTIIDTIVNRKYLFIELVNREVIPLPKNTIISGLELAEFLNGEDGKIVDIGICIENPTNTGEPIKNTIKIDTLLAKYTVSQDGHTKDSFLRFGYILMWEELYIKLYETKLSE